jgi:glycosyltransferase involved in cell wall biosynthesis
MRVGVVIYGSLDSLSGGYLYDRKLVEYLRTIGDSVQVISMPLTHYASAILQNGSSKFRQQLLKLEVDILLEDELNHPSLFLMNGWLRSRVTYPLIGIVHHLRSCEKHPGWVLPLYRTIERRFLNTLDGYIFNSTSTQREVAALASHPHPFVIATPGGDGLDGKTPSPELYAHSQYSHMGEDISRLEIIFVGNLIERKGLHTLLEALGTMAQIDWRLRVVGRSDIDPGYTRRCLNLTVQTGISNKVEFIGALADSDLVNAYQASQLLVVPSSFEGFGIVYLEAMRWGVVPVGSSAGGAAEVIHNNENGWLVAPGDSDGLAAILRNACLNQEMLSSMGQAARQRYAAFPTWNQTAERIRTFLLSLI